MTNKRWRLRAFLQGFKDGASIGECVLRDGDSHFADYREGYKMGQEQFRRAADWYRSVLGMPGALDVVLAESNPNEPEPDPCCLAVVGEEHPGQHKCFWCKHAVCERHSNFYVAGRFCDTCARESGAQHRGGTDRR